MNGERAHSRRSIRRLTAALDSMSLCSVISRQAVTDKRIWIRAYIRAASVVDIPGRVGAVLLLRGRQRTCGSGGVRIPGRVGAVSLFGSRQRTCGSSGDDSEGNCDLRE